MFPGRAVAEELLSDRAIDIEVYFICDKNASTARKSGEHFLRIYSGNIRGGSPLRMLFVVVGFFESFGLLLRYKPGLLVGLGGYVSGPAVAAALILGIPVILQEQNYLPGVTNRILSLFAEEVETSFPISVGFPRRARLNFTGNPVRREIFLSRREFAFEKLGLDDTKKTVVVFGGSQGAQGINLGMIDALRDISKRKEQWQFLHITGESDFFVVRDAYQNAGIKAGVFRFIERMGDVYACADIVVCRSGGGSIAEITGWGLPAIYIPYPSAAESHQELNARFVSERGAGVVVREKEFKSGRLSDALSALMDDGERRAEIASCSKNLGRPYAAKEVKQRIKALVLSNRT